MEITNDRGPLQTVTLNGDLIYSKLQTGDFPENKQVLEQLKRRL